MFNISNFLEKFSKNIKLAELYKKQIIEVIERQTQIKISPKDLEIKNVVVYIKSSPAIKNKIFIYKTELLKEIESLVSTKITDIK